MAKKFLEVGGQRFEIAYEWLDHGAEENIVFLHGWGSNKELMKQAFGSHFKGFNHCYIDLPGFGQSHNEIVLDTQQYAQIVRTFLHSLFGDQMPCDDFKKNCPLVLVGHSFGGKIATLLSPKELILLSSAGIVCPKSLKVKVKILFAKILKRLGLSGKLLRSSDADGLNEAMYQTFKNVVNEDFSSIFKSFASKAYIFWGRQDTATPLSSGEKIHSLIAESEFCAFEGDHYFFLHYAKDIENQFVKWRQGCG